MYKVIAYFVDLKDSNRPYNVGDIFPHKDCGYKVTEERFAELSGSENKQHKPLIQLAEDKPKAAKGKKAAE